MRASVQFEVDFNVDGKVIDFLTSKLLDATPEEKVRQRYLKILHYEYNYPKDLMRREVPIQYGSSILTDKDGNPIRADIVVYKNQAAAIRNDQ